MAKQKDEWIHKSLGSVGWWSGHWRLCVLCLSLRFFWSVTVERACQESRTKKSSLPANVSSEFELTFERFDFLLLIISIHLSLSNNKGVFLHYLLPHCPKCSLSQSYLTDRCKNIFLSAYTAFLTQIIYTHGKQWLAELQVSVFQVKLLMFA